MIFKHKFLTIAFLLGLQSFVFSGCTNSSTHQTELPAEVPSALVLSDLRLTGKAHETETGIIALKFESKNKAKNIYEEYLALIEKNGYRKNGSEAEGDLYTIKIVMPDHSSVDITITEINNKTLVLVKIQLVTPTKTINK